MQQMPLGVSAIQVSRLAYGCWRVAGSWDPTEITDVSRAAGVSAIQCAYESGYMLFDTADIYSRGESERVLGCALKDTAGMRENVVILTKCGVRPAGTPHAGAPQRYDFSAAHIIASCEGSLTRLGVDTIDVFMLHRPDFLADPGEIAGAFTKLKEQGKVRHFAVSNFRATLLTALQVACPMPLVAHQIEASLTMLEPFEDGTLDQCLIEQITPMAWSPLGGGVLGDGARRVLNSQKGYNVEGIVPVLDEIARDRGVTRSAVALAWLMRHPARIVPIVGTVSKERIREAAKADDVELTREEWYRLLLAARGCPLP